MSRRFTSIKLLVYVLTPLFASGFTPDLISNQIVSHAEWLGLRQSTHDLFRSWLDEDEVEYVTLRLRAGVPYVALGACDQDCTDLDFDLIDPFGNIVSSDHASDDEPVVRVTPAFSGTYELKVTMYECSIEPCEWGVGVYRR